MTAQQRRKRIGLLIPPVNIVMEPELQRWAPQGVTIHAHRLYRTKAVTEVAQLQEMTSRLEEDARLLAFARPDIIVYGCTSGSSLEPRLDERLVERIERASGIPAIATAGAVVQALRNLGITRVAVATPYIDEINERELAFLRDYGFQPVSLEALHIRTSYAIPDTDPEDIYRLARRADRPDAEGVFISCTNLPSGPIIQRLENDLGKPVVTSNQASLWCALRRIGVEDPIPGAGCLMLQPIAAATRTPPGR
jgi:arylmalonate decarboxylase